jgi:putative SOS response-associated peptidase YedK
MTQSLVVVPQQAWSQWLNATPDSASQLLTAIPETEYTAAFTEPTVKQGERI